MLCLFCLYGNREYSSSFQSEAVSIKFFFQVSTQVKGKWRHFWSGSKHSSRFIDLSSKLLHMGVILTIMKVLIILFLLCQEEQGTPWQYSKQISKISFQLSFRIYTLLAQPNLRGKKDISWKGARRGTTLWDYPQEHLVVIRDKKSLCFCEIWNNPSPALFFIRPPYK